MSTTVIGGVLAEVDGRYADIFVETGRGWGGDGEDPHRVILNCPGKDLFMLLTIKQAQHLCELIQTIARMDEEEDGGMLKVEADFSHWNDNPCRPRMDTSLLHVGDELKFTDVDGKAYILKVIREAEE